MSGDHPVVREPSPDEDRVKPLPLVGVAVGSLAAGFLLVYTLGQSGAERQVRQPDQGPAADASPVSPLPNRPSQGAAPPEPAASALAQDIPHSAVAPDARGQPASAVAPAGVRFGEAYYFRCWSAGEDDPAEEGTCDPLPIFEQRVRDQLVEIAACGSGVHGTLSLGVEVHFGARETRWWSGRSTTITPIEALIQCVRARLRDTSLEGIEHRYRKYTVFLTIEM